MGSRARCSSCWIAGLHYFVHAVLVVAKEGKHYR